MTSDSTPDFNAVGALLGNTLAQAHAQDAQQQQLATAFGFLQRSMGGRGRGNGGYGNSNQGYNGYNNNHTPQQCWFCEGLANIEGRTHHARVCPMRLKALEEAKNSTSTVPKQAAPDRMEELEKNIARLTSTVSTVAESVVNNRKAPATCESEDEPVVKSAPVKRTASGGIRIGKVARTKAVLDKIVDDDEESLEEDNAVRIRTLLAEMHGLKNRVVALTKDNEQMKEQLKHAQAEKPMSC